MLPAGEIKYMVIIDIIHQFIPLGHFTAETS